MVLGGALIDHFAVGLDKGLGRHQDAVEEINVLPPEPGRFRRQGDAESREAGRALPAKAGQLPISCSLCAPLSTCRGHPSGRSPTKQHRGHHLQVISFSSQNVVTAPCGASSGHPAIARRTRGFDRLDHSPIILCCHRHGPETPMRRSEGVSPPNPGSVTDVLRDNTTDRFVHVCGWASPLPESPKIT